jgi:hypothetical protein
LADAVYERYESQNFHPHSKLQGDHQWLNMQVLLLVY